MITLADEADIIAAQIIEMNTYFAYDHLPTALATISAPFGDLAAVVARRAPGKYETLVALRKLIEAKDAAVRAAL